MEQTTDIKNELQQELQGLQQHVEQHSTFHSDVWRRSVKRYSGHLYWLNMVCVVFLVGVMVFASIAFILDNWPWWLVAALDLFMGGMLVESIVVTKGLRKADVQSRNGLLSLRDSVQKSTTYSKRKRRLFGIVGYVLIAVFDVYLFFHDRQAFVSVLIASIVCLPFGRVTAKRVKKRYDDLGEEIDELLKD